MKFEAKRDKSIAIWDDVKHKFIGDSELIKDIETFIFVMSNIGNDAFVQLMNRQEILNIQVIEYVPDEYPEGTLDV
jgi:hypothetical protein